MATYRAIHDYTSTGKNQLSFKKGELFVLQGKCGNGWFTVKAGSNSGLVPSSYLEPVVEKDSAAATGSSFTVLYEFVAKEAYQLTVVKNEQVFLNSKHTKDWWSVRNKEGKSGLVPATYLKIEDKKQEDTSHQQTKEEAREVLLSIDRAIEKIHNEAGAAGGMYTAQQRATLQHLVSHRQTVVKEHGLESLKEDTPPSETVSDVAQSDKLIPRRKAPPPPSENSKVDSLDLAGVKMRERGENASFKERPRSDMLAVLQAPPPPKRHESLSSRSQLSDVSKSQSASSREEKPPKTSDNEDNASLSSESSAGAVGGISPDTKRRITSYLSKAGLGTELESVQEDRAELPTEFSPEMGLELIEVVRERTGLSHGKSALAVEGILSHIGEKVPVINPVMEGLLEALHKSQMDESTKAAESNKDLVRLKEIFFEIQEARDDSQQRGWAIRDDSGALASFLEELLQLLYDADPGISRTVIQEDKYENILILISYYQLEHRVPLRILLLKIIGAMFTLDDHVISVALQSVLPNELGHGIQQNLSDTEKVVWSSVVCTMMFSTAEQLPFSVYDQWNIEFVHFLLDNVESPPDTDLEEEIPDTFMNVLLSFNQHFEDPETNILMRVLKENPNPRVFSEKLMLLVNRGEDPVSIHAPCCPDSLTKILLDLFADKDTATIFYTSDMMVLIDIITRQLHDLCPGEKLRSHYLELLRRLLGSTNYSEHKHRQEDLTSCLKRIVNEHEPESQPDQEAVRAIWQAYPGVLDDTSPPE